MLAYVMQTSLKTATPETVAWWVAIACTNSVLAASIYDKPLWDSLWFFWGV